jgi:hypothetical protein
VPPPAPLTPSWQRTSISLIAGSPLVKVSENPVGAASAATWDPDPRTGAGGDRPLVDRGVRGANGMPLEPGTGLGRDFAREGVAGISWDGPHGGPQTSAVSTPDRQDTPGILDPDADAMLWH